jgi:hypothetical protein
MKASKVRCPFFYSEQGLERCTLFETNEQLRHFNIYKRDSVGWWPGFVLLPDCLSCRNPTTCPKRLNYKEEIATQHLEERSF